MKKAKIFTINNFVIRVESLKRRREIQIPDNLKDFQIWYVHNLMLKFDRNLTSRCQEKVADKQNTGSENVYY